MMALTPPVYLPCSYIGNLSVIVLFQILFVITINRSKFPEAVHILLPAMPIFYLQIVNAPQNQDKWCRQYPDQSITGIFFSRVIYCETWPHFFFCASFSWMCAFLNLPFCFCVLFYRFFLPFITTLNFQSEPATPRSILAQQSQIQPDLNLPTI